MHSKNDFFYFKLLVTLPNNTEAGKRVSATEITTFEKQNHISSTDDLTVHFGQCISTKDDPFVPNTALLVAYWQTVYVCAWSIRYAIDFSTAVRKRSLQASRNYFNF